jgi:LysR family transcriptional regulator for metE and metH
VIETTDIMLQMVACERGVAALPAWLVAEYQATIAVVPVRLGKRGLNKQIFVGVRVADKKVDYIASFIKLAGTKRAAPGSPERRKRLPELLNDKKV